MFDGRDREPTFADFSFETLSPPLAITLSERRESENLLVWYEWRDTHGYKRNLCAVGRLVEIATFVNNLLNFVLNDAKK